MYPDITVQIEQVEPGPLLGALRSQELDGGVVMGRMRGRGRTPQATRRPDYADCAHQPCVGLPGATAQSRDRGCAQIRRAGQDGPAARHEEDSWVPAVKLGMLKDQALVLEHGIGESHSDARDAP